MYWTRFDRSVPRKLPQKVTGVWPGWRIFREFWIKLVSQNTECLVFTAWKLYSQFNGWFVFFWILFDWTNLVWYIDHVNEDDARCSFDNLRLATWCGNKIKAPVVLRHSWRNRGVTKHSSDLVLLVCRSNPDQIINKCTWSDVFVWRIR